MKVIIAGGGTAGHINPGLAIAKYIREKCPESDIMFIGTERGLEKSLVPREGFEIRLIKVRGLSRSLSLSNLLTVKELFQGIMEAKKIIRDFGPDLVIGTGGYVCGPVLLVASMLKLPTMIHEQNAFPSLTNRVLSRFVDAVAISFKDTEKFFKRAKMLVHTGNPIRPDLFDTDRKKALSAFHLDSSKPVLLITGGSQGARKLNQVSGELVKEAVRSGRFQILWATGEKNFTGVTEELKAGGIAYDKAAGICIKPYIFNMNEAMAISDLVICRAGALTISEITALGIPSILIPLPTAAANHQEHNARELEKNGVSIVILEKDLTPELLLKQVTALLDDGELLVKMGRNAKKMGITDAVEKLYMIAREVQEKKKIQKKIYKNH